MGKAPINSFARSAEFFFFEGCKLVRAKREKIIFDVGGERGGTISP